MEFISPVHYLFSACISRQTKWWFTVFQTRLLSSVSEITACLHVAGDFSVVLHEIFLHLPSYLVDIEDYLQFLFNYKSRDCLHYFKMLFVSYFLRFSILIMSQCGQVTFNMGSQHLWVTFQTVSLGLRLFEALFSFSVSRFKCCYLDC